RLLASPSSVHIGQLDFPTVAKRPASPRLIGVWGMATPRVVRLVSVAGILAALVMPTLASCGRPGQLTQLKSGECKAGNPLAGVYLPSRLTLKTSCATVSGTVDCLKHEDDGDIHIRLRVDPAFAGLLTPANTFQQCPNQTGPHLVVEIIPQS